MRKLGVNIDHVATLRETRQVKEPDPVEAARICENAGADSIVCHLREDRRHIQEDDIRRMRKVLKGRLNVEMSLNSKIISIVTSIKPDQVTLVPEKRKELTTEGGLNVVAQSSKIKSLKRKYDKLGIEISLFIDPVKKQIKKCADMGFRMIELHTGKYASAKNKQSQKRELKKLKEMAEYADSLGLTVNVGHGLKYTNSQEVAQIACIEEFNTGHSIVARSVFVGLGNAVREMRMLIGAR